MNFEEYQNRAHKTSLNTKIGNDLLIYPILGLTSEVGEIAGKAKKFYRDNTDVHEFKDMMKKELGDCLWYLSELCTQIEISLVDIAEANIEKLESRKARNVITGSGDNR